jgi:hypothetical protein
MPTSSSIDLAKGKSTLSDDLIRWALGFGRFLIIIVEIIAFSAFIYRFVLDRELVDLNDKIKGEQAIVASLKDRENEYRNLQERIAKIKNVSSTGNTKVELINDIIASTPEQIEYGNILAEDDKLLLTINVSSVPELTRYINFLQEYEQIESAIITGIDNSSGVSFVKVDLDAKLKGNYK